jgi:short-subunit dehydrogenase
VIAVTGYKTTIVQELRELVDEHVIRMSMDLKKWDCQVNVPRGVDRFVLAAGVLHQATILEQTPAQMRECLTVNMVNVVRICETITRVNSNARICIIGSESGFKGSYNELYALSKAAIHAYVSWEGVLPTQSLVCVAPPIIRDSGMTRSRKDYPKGLENRATVSARDVAERVKSALYDDSYLGRSVVERMVQE